MPSYVYRFLDTKGNILYIGRTDNLKSRMAQHFNGKGHLGAEKYSQVETIEYIELPTHNDAGVMEWALIAALRPPFNEQYTNGGRLTVRVGFPEDSLWKKYDGVCTQRKEDNLYSLMLMVDEEASQYNLNDPQERNRFFDAVATLMIDEIDINADVLVRKICADSIVKKYGVGNMTAQNLLTRVGNLAMKRMGYPKARTEERKQHEENASVKAQKLILTWIVNDPGAARVTMKYLSPADFTVPLYQEVATMVFEQIEKGDVNVSRLLNAFGDSEEHSEVSSLFNATIHLEGDDQRGIAYADALICVREASLAAQKAAGDGGDIIKLLQLQKLKSRRKEISREFLEALRA